MCRAAHTRPLQPGARGLPTDLRRLALAARRSLVCGAPQAGSACPGESGLSAALRPGVCSLHSCRSGQPRAAAHPRLQMNSANQAEVTQRAVRYCFFPRLGHLTGPEADRAGHWVKPSVSAYSVPSSAGYWACHGGKTGCPSAAESMGGATM